MKVIKDNSNKTKRVKCKNCKSIFKVKLIEFTIGFAGRKFVNCPVCKYENWIN